MIRWVLVAVLGLAPLTACDGSGDVSDAKPSPSAASSATESESGSATPTDPGPVVECPTNIVLDPDPALPDAVPDGATSVRLCAAAPGEVSPPVDALTTNVTGVVQAVNDQMVVTRGCADRQLPVYQLAFGYPDGTDFVVTGRFTGCGELLVGSTRRAHAQPALDRFVRLLSTQRATSSPPAGAAVDPGDLSCKQPSQHWTRELGDPTGLTVAILCFGNWREPGPRTRRVVIGARDLATLVRSMRTDTVPPDEFSCPYYSPIDFWIVGANAWGDPITMDRGCNGHTLSSGREWKPRGEARRLVEHLIDRAR